MGFRRPFVEQGTSHTGLATAIERPGFFSETFGNLLVDQGMFKAVNTVMGLAREGGMKI